MTDSVLVDILRMSDAPHTLHSANRIEELTKQLADATARAATDAETIAVPRALLARCESYIEDAKLVFEEDDDEDMIETADQDIITIRNLLTAGGDTDDTE